MFDQVKLLYDNSLWSSLSNLAPYALSHDVDTEKCGKKRHLLLCMIGDAYFEQRNFKKAEAIYKEAIQMRKQFKIIKKSDGSAASAEDSQVEGKLASNSSDVEIKYKLHLCYMNTNQVKMLKIVPIPDTQIVFYKERIFLIK